MRDWFARLDVHQHRALRAYFDRDLSLPRLAVCLAVLETAKRLQQLARRLHPHP